MKASHVLATVVRMGLFTWAFAAHAGTATFQGVSVDYGTANASWVNGDLVLTYTSTSVDGTLSLDCPVVADMLAVGGGAGGQDASYSTSSGLPGGGGAGGMVTNSQDFVAAHYEVTVGAGGFARRSLTKGPRFFVRRTGITRKTASSGSCRM